MPIQYASGLEDPAVRNMIMSSAQQRSSNQPVSSMGLGIQSNIQGKSSGNNSLATVKKLLAAVKAEKAKKKKKKDKDKKLKAKDQKRSVGRSDRSMAPAAPIQLPEPIEPGGLI